MKGNTVRMATWVLAVLLLPWIVQAQGLTEQQYQVLKNDILVVNQAEFAQAVNDNNDQFISDEYNKVKNPAYWVWKTSLTEQEIYEATAPDATTWNWATYKAQTVQDRDSWSIMLRPGKINPSLKQTRDAFTAIFGGQGASLAQNNFLLALSRKQAKRGEALFATGNGAVATPSTLTYQGDITRLDVAHALRGVPIS